ncbi:formylglycine-generating enzyme family protein, partial [Myxococcota bacterium]|nr:formylglycine-generating enzyme family protein [Myxococcota bacterium]
EAASVEAARALSEALAAFHAVLGVDGEHGPTRAALGALYYIAFEAAERDGDRVQMAHYENLVRAFDDDGAFAAKLQGDGALTLDLPAGIGVDLSTYALDERVLKPSPRRQLLSNVVDPIPMGSYLLTINGPGLSEVAVPFYVERQQRVRLRVRLFPDQVIGEGFVHVAGGPAKLGGDPHAQLALPAHTEEVGDFFLARRPITAADYLEFIEDTYRQGGRAAAERRAPRSAPGAPPLWRFTHQGQVEIPEEDARGIPWHPNWPVVNVSYEDAEAYCRWASQRDGRPYRLPTEVEWEKAARGADGRLFPWGDAFEPSFCHMGNTFPGAPRRGGSGAFEADISPYNVMDMAGGISEWTASWLGAPDSGQRIIKGGHWASGPVECRAASRFTKTREQVLPTLGFRLAVDA